jgi:hypothetical protein
MADPEELQYTEVDDEVTFDSLNDLQGTIDALRGDLDRLIALGDDISDPEGGRSDWSGETQRSFRRVWQEGGWSAPVTIQGQDGEAMSANDVQSALLLILHALDNWREGGEAMADFVVETDDEMVFE